MQMLGEWMRIKMWEPSDPNKGPGIILPDGVEKKSMTEDDIFFHVLEIGPLVKEVKVGNIISISFMSSDMFRQRLPGDNFPSYLARESAVMGILRKQP